MGWPCLSSLSILEQCVVVGNGRKRHGLLGLRSCRAVHRILGFLGLLGHRSLLVVPGILALLGVRRILGCLAGRCLLVGLGVLVVRPGRAHREPCRADLADRVLLAVLGLRMGRGVLVGLVVRVRLPQRWLLVLLAFLVLQLGLGVLGLRWRLARRSGKRKPVGLAGRLARHHVLAVLVLLAGHRLLVGLGVLVGREVRWGRLRSRSIRIPGA
jgi:hypothetical protein